MRTVRRPLTVDRTRLAPSATPLIRYFRYSPRFIRPSSHTTIDPTVSLPWSVEISKPSTRRGTAASDSIVLSASRVARGTGASLKRDV